VAAIASKCGKSQSHIYARLALLQLEPEVAEAFQHEKITASHANLIARLPRESQAEAFAACWRKDYQDTEPHLLPARHLATWIEENLYLALDEAPFNKEDPSLNPAAGTCGSCPRRSGHNRSLFGDVLGDQCLDKNCFQLKISVHLDRVIAATPGLVQIEDGWRSAREHKPGAVPRGHFREIESVEENPDSELGPSCAAAKTAIIISGNRVGKTVTVCTDNNCPVHDPRAKARQASNPAPVMAPAAEAETEAEAEERKRNYERQRREYEQEQERRAEESRQEDEQREKEWEVERARTEKLQKARSATFERILEDAPPLFSAAQFRFFLRALINLDPYTFADDVAEHFVADANNDKSAEGILLAGMEGLPDDKLTGFALRLVLTGNIPIPREGEVDSLTEAETAFVPAKPSKTAAKTAKAPAPVKSAGKTAGKRSTAKNRVAA
jgi:ParB family chromosome partitioning protein